MMQTFDCVLDLIGTSPADMGKFSGGVVLFILFYFIFFRFS